MPVAAIDRIEGSHVEQLVDLFAGEWWSAGRDLAAVHEVLADSQITRGLVEGDQLVAFARVTGSLVDDATLLDVIVRPDRRGEGLGALLVDTALGDHRLARLRGPITLRCRVDLASFYERWGFVVLHPTPPDPVRGDGVVMRRHGPRPL